ncbi:heterokaryon incompatibility [Xylariaceae sp. FL1272]|nr:heterokaryon incompatibility [Xylariaceae sp. FL1272]
MRLLVCQADGTFRLTDDLLDPIPPYAILSHTWSRNEKDEVTYNDMCDGSVSKKSVYRKILLCGKQAARDGLGYFWIDSCCMNRPNHTELSEAITSMFAWYQRAVKCDVYLSDVTLGDDKNTCDHDWQRAFSQSKWFTRGWTLQELLAPSRVEFYSSDHHFLGDRMSLAVKIHRVTGIPVAALSGTSHLEFSVDERMAWSERRLTRRPEDRAYCMLGLFNGYMLPIYGEGIEGATFRLRKVID